MRHKPWKKAADLAVVDEKKYADGNRYLYVPDALTFLQQIANFHRRQLAIPILGITGTNGKPPPKNCVMQFFRVNSKLLPPRAISTTTSEFL